MNKLRILAGQTAFDHIRQHGLQQSDVSAIFGASGAAKWLAIYGLDRAIFSEWLTDVDHPIDVFGTSIGAFKLAAACRRDAAAALDNLATAYIEQSYPHGITADYIDQETKKILDLVLGGGGSEEILSHPQFRYHCGTVLARGLLGRDTVSSQKIAMVKAFLLSGLGRNANIGAMERVIFSDVRANGAVRASDRYVTHYAPLSPQNLHRAVQASGSIPVIMAGVSDIAGGPLGTHRDGGLLDYHPLPGSLWQGGGIVLYPHFYTEAIAGWFDKYFSWRKTPASQLDKAVLLAPSEEFIASTDLGRIPDRRDFLRMQHDDAKRKRLWQDSATRSLELGEEFLQLVQSGDIAQRVELI
ncbi:hypothetical protein [Zhongshania aquimaris]|uniref:Patatin-like phospholipase family protein n=1 Tax=Zhongshania aquimaris TaxID=2857107 RepID=A0ABS6VQG4_9GAMM|nr:hypothetical protein [Zhongshania aquimaris]MBW2940560.1 hypothetical protein [Zhongshania aquimaris]